MLGELSYDSWVEVIEDSGLEQHFNVGGHVALDNLGEVNGVEMNSFSE